MTGGNPFDEIEAWIERMSEQVESADWSGLGRGTVPVDVVDTGEGYELRADLPGYDREDIDLTLTDGSLSITAARTGTAEADEGTYLRRERRHDRVRRSVRLPEPVDEEGTTATYEGGVLTVTLPKEDAGGRQIDIE